MSEPHPSRGELELYVIGALPRAAHDRLEAHVAACEACSKLLAEEARFEMALHEVARQAHDRRVVSHRPLRRRGSLVGIGVLVAAAAGVLLVVEPCNSSGPVKGELRSARVEAPAASAEPSASYAYACVDPAHFRGCVADAHHRGFAVTYPTLSVPRYEFAAATYLH